MEAWTTTELGDAEIENIVRRSYQYVAMYNVNNKGTMDPDNPTAPGGWNRIKANTTLTDHNMRIIARPNSDRATRGSDFSRRSEFRTVTTRGPS
jgi:hypothetical protein